MKEIKSIISLAAVFIVIAFLCFNLSACASNSNNSDNNVTNSSTKKTITLTTSNVESYLGISYSVNKTIHSVFDNRYGDIKYYNHEYTITTYSLNDKYKFKNVVLVIGVKNSSDDQNSISVNGYGSFFFVRNGPLASYMTPARPIVKKVVSGYIEYED